jgi:hypothetical protein
MRWGCIHQTRYLPDTGFVYLTFLARARSGSTFRNAIALAYSNDKKPHPAQTQLCGLCSLSNQQRATAIRGSRSLAVIG